MKLPKNFEDIDGMGGPERSKADGPHGPWKPPAPLWPKTGGSASSPAGFLTGGRPSRAMLPPAPIGGGGWNVVKQGPEGVAGGTIIQSPTKPSNFVVTSVRRGAHYPGLPTWVGYFAPPTSDDITMDTNYMGVDGRRARKSAIPPAPWRSRGSAIPPADVLGNVGRGSGVPSDLIPEPWRRFDGGAVKQNWVPLVVLGVSLAVGIGISEWASKKYIK